MARKIVAGNWKSNKDWISAQQLFTDLESALESYAGNTEVIVAPPTLYLTSLAPEQEKLNLSAQNCSAENEGAFTGEITAKMLNSAGINYTLIGHSERRSLYGETDSDVSKKVDRALEAGITPILCCGEQLQHRTSGSHFEVVYNQLNEAMLQREIADIKKIVIAYEPVWAIGTGVTATSDQAQEMHANIRQWLEEVVGDEAAVEIPILYGGSCKPSNAAELFACKDVDGGLIGGASLNVEDFVAIIKARG
jgi:triosephosphate isomerase (TIM)